MPAWKRTVFIEESEQMRRLIIQQQEDEEQEINITPMLDVVFIMLIFFIVTASFVKEIGIDVNSPDQNQTPPKKEEKNVVVRITADDRIWIDGRQVDPRAVRANIERRHAENPEGTVVVLPHAESTTTALIQVMDASRQAGVDPAIGEEN